MYILKYIDKGLSHHRFLYILPFEITTCYDKVYLVNNKAINVSSCAKRQRIIFTCVIFVIIVKLHMHRNLVPRIYDRFI